MHAMSASDCWDCARARQHNGDWCFFMADCPGCEARALAGAKEPKPEPEPKEKMPSKEVRLKQRRIQTNAGKFSDGRVNLIHVQMVTALMRGEKSRKDLVQETGAHPRTVSDFLKLMHDQGAIYLADLRTQDGAHRPSEIFAMQRVPFERPDIEREAL